MPTTYFIYCRKSTEREDRQILSIKSQERELREVAQREHLTLAAAPSTKKRSADKRGRPVFGELMQRIEAGAANGLLYRACRARGQAKGV